MHQQPFHLPQVRAGNPEPVQGREETEEEERGMTMDILVYKDGRFVCTENPLKAGSLEGLAMLVTNPQDGDVLKYDAASGTWLNGTGSDFAPTITSPQDGQVIKYNGTAWVNGTGGGDFTPDISNPQDGDTLVYNATQQKWVNGAASGGGGVTIVHMDEDTGALDKTAQEICDAMLHGVVEWTVPNTVMRSILLSVSDREGETPGTTEYVFTFAGTNQGAFGLDFVATSLNGYPVISI